MRMLLWATAKKRPYRGQNIERTHLRLERLEPRDVPTVISPQFAELQANAGRPHVATFPMPSVSVDEQGSVDVAFVENVSTSQSQIVVRRFRADGTPQTANATLVVAGPAPTGMIGQPKIGVRRDGTFVVAYIAPSASGRFTTVFAHRFLSDGTSTGTAILVPTNGQDQRNQIEPSIAVLDATGAFYVTWTDQVTPTNGDIRARGFNASGNAINPADQDIAVGATNEHEATIAGVAVSSSVVVLVSFTRDGAAQSQNIFARRFDANLMGQGAEFAVNTTAGAAAQSGIAIDSTFRSVIVWTDATNRLNASIKMRRYDPGGSAQTQTEEAADTSPGSKALPRVATAQDDGRYVIAYIDTGSGTSRVVYQEFNAGGVAQGAIRNFTGHNSAQAAPALGASHNAVFAMAVSDDVTGQDEPWLRTFKSSPSHFFAVGGAPGRVQIRRASDGSLVAAFQPFGTAYTGSVSVAWGDVNGDGIPDLVVGATVGNPDLRVYDGAMILNGTFSAANPDSARLAMFFPYAVQFNVGVNVAVGDINGNGFADIVTGATAGNPDVHVYSGKDIANGRFNPTGSSLLAAFFAYGLQFNVGANVAVGDLNNDGYADIVTGATAGNPHVKVYNGKAIVQGTFNEANADASLLAQFFAYGQRFNVGAYVAVGDTDGDGHVDLITGATAGNPHVKVYNGAAIAAGSFNSASPDASLLTQFFAYDLQFNVGVRVAAADIEANGQFDILTGASNGSPHYRVVKGNATTTKPPAVRGIEGIPTDMQGGVFVGGL